MLCPVCGDDVIETRADKLPVDEDSKSPASILFPKRCPHCDIRLR
ncbi:hypothetical protein [Corallococcus terminator]|nr:hypothetical protein [Corallococcus terminator]